MRSVGVCVAATAPHPACHAAIPNTNGGESMRIGIPTETRAGEKRVAATPETVKKLVGSGHHQIVVQSGAGAGAFFPDSEYTSAGASIVPSASEIYQQSDIVLKVRGPEDGELAQFRPDSILIGLLAPHEKK